MATWSLCTKFGSEQQQQKIFINLDNVITVEDLGDRTFVTPSLEPTEKFILPLLSNAPRADH